MVIRNKRNNTFRILFSGNYYGNIMRGMIDVINYHQLSQWAFTINNAIITGAIILESIFPMISFLPSGG